MTFKPFVLCFPHSTPATTPCDCADINRDGVYTFADVTSLIDILLMRKWTEVLSDCPIPHDEGQAGGEGNEGGGEGRQMMLSPGGGGVEGDGATDLEQGGGGGSNTVAGDGANDESAPEEAEDPVFTARWNAFGEWLEAHPPELYPDLSEDEWNAITTDVMIDMVYQVVAP